MTDQTVRADPSLRFWLDYVERRGAAFDDAGDHAFVVLPDELQAPFGLPESVAVTADPVVAREDGAVLLGPGHPLLDRAAGEVVERGDGGRLWLPWPRSLPPDGRRLVERARERVPVDHGRIDLAGHPAQVYTPVLRLGALVTYTVSLDLQLQEREEVWLDGRSGVELPGLAQKASAGACPLAEPDARHSAVVPHLGCSLPAAHSLLRQRAADRERELARDADADRRAELARVETYYAGQLSSIARRRRNATDDRRRLLDAQAEATRAEQARRRRDVDEQYRPSYELRPYRLHVVLVPALRLPVVVRRGARAYAFELTWMLPFADFAPAPCPHCGAAVPLVAGRERLGCESCLARPLRPVPAASSRP